MSHQLGPTNGRSYENLKLLKTILFAMGSQLYSLLLFKAIFSSGYQYAKFALVDI